MGKPFGKASRRTFGRIGTLVPFPCWNSLGVMSSDTLKFSKQPPSEALKDGLPVSVLQLSGRSFPLLLRLSQPPFPPPIMFHIPVAFLLSHPRKPQIKLLDILVIFQLICGTIHHNASILHDIPILSDLK